jgi:hypothetical protein
MSFWELVFEHPVASFFLVSAAGASLAGIAAALRGKGD